MLPDAFYLYARDAYLEVAAWTSWQSNSAGEPVGHLDALPNDWHDNARLAALNLVRDFVDDEVERAVRTTGMSGEQLGHDLWLSRNHHGTGFWDRGYGPIGDRLHKLTEPYGDDDAYLGTDGFLHLECENPYALKEV